MSEQANDADMEDLTRACLRSLTALMNRLDQTMAEAGIRRAQRGSVLISVLSTAMLQALRSFVHADDRHSCVTEVARKIHVRLMSGAPGGKGQISSRT